MSYAITTLKTISDEELVKEVVDRKTLRSNVRAMIYHGMAAIEQAQLQRKPPGVIEIRRMEMQLAANVIAFINGASE